MQTTGRYDPYGIEQIVAALRTPQGTQVAGDVVPLAGAVSSGDNYMHAGPAARTPEAMVDKLLGANTSNVRAMPSEVFNSWLVRNKGLPPPPTITPFNLLGPGPHGQGGDLPPKM